MRGRDRTLSLVREALDAGDETRALHEIATTVIDWVTGTPLVRRALFGCGELDEACQEIGRRIRERVGEERPGASDDRASSDAPLDVYLATAISSGGGHTRLIGDLARAAGRRAILVLTGVELDSGATDARAREAAGFDPGSIIALDEGADLGGKAVALSRLLARLRPDRLFLLNHHHDAVIAACAQPGCARVIHYVHHCDSEMALGVHLWHARHLDVTPHAAARCRALLGIESVAIPLVCEDHGVRGGAGRGRDDVLTLCTSGAPSKFWPGGRIRYADAISALLRATRARFVHIGPIPADARAELDAALDVVGVDRARFRQVDWVPSLWRAMGEFGVDLYLSSFPVGGARASVEVMGSGTPAVWYTAGARGPCVDLNLTYPGAAIWTDPDQLIRIVGRADAGWLRDQARMARERYETAHSPAILRGLVADDFASGERVGSPVARSYSVEYGALLERWHLAVGEAEEREELLTGARRRNASLQEKLAVLKARVRDVQPLGPAGSPLDRWWKRLRARVERWVRRALGARR